MKTPTIIILSGPSGAGKTTLLNKVFRKKNIKGKFIRAISYTTRKIRPKEKNGRDYFFISKRKFLQLREKGFFLENQKVLDNYYGTAKYFYDRAVKENKNLILCIDVKGGMYLKKKQKEGKIVTLFIAAPSELDLFKRLKMRTEAMQTIQKRITLAKKEMKVSKQYDSIIINKDLSKSLKELEKVILRAT
ncbi:MAG: guanylate kinase [Candidatus Omnitrophica bacterium]|jgi:guanylate kinase|nr:guanylate kinase [Candidatus Omnitrophota bacterium]